MIKHLSFMLPVASKDERLQPVLEAMPTSLAARAMFVRSALAYGLFYLNNVDANRFNNLSSEISFSVSKDNVEFKRFRLLRDATPDRVFVHIKMLAPMALKVYVTTSLILFSEMLNAETFYSHFSASSEKPLNVLGATAATGRLSEDSTSGKLPHMASSEHPQLTPSRPEHAVTSNVDAAMHPADRGADITISDQPLTSQDIGDESEQEDGDQFFTDVPII